MANLNDALLTAAITVPAGVAVFGVTELLQRFWLEPVHEHAKAVGAAAFALFYYGDCYANPGHVEEKRLQEAKVALRKVAGDLAATAAGMRFCRICRVFRLTPTRENAIRRWSHYWHLERYVRR